jgi:hypothetical protein
MKQQPQQNVPTAKQPEWEVTLELCKPFPCYLPGRRFDHQPSDHDLYSAVLSSLARWPARWRRRHTPEGERILGCDAQVSRIVVREPEGGQRKIDAASIMEDPRATVAWETLEKFRARERAGKGRIEPRAERCPLDGRPTGTTLWVWRPAA